MFNIIIKDTKILYRDKSTVFLTILFPIILVFLLGNLLGNLDRADSVIEPMKVYYKVESTNLQDKHSIDSFIETINENESIAMKESTDEKNTIDQVNNGEASGYIKFMDNMDIEFFEGLDNVQNKALNIVLKTFTSQLSSIDILQKNMPEKMAQIISSNENSTENSINESENVVDKDLGYNRTMLDYYAVVMVVMIMFMGGAIGGASVIYENKGNGTLHRMLASPKSRISIYIQTIIGSIPQTLIQVIAIMVPSVFIFGANYAQNTPDNLLLFTMFVILGVTINAIFTVVGFYVKSNPTMLIMPFLWVAMFLSGTFSKQIYIEGFSNKIPIWLVQNAAFELTVFGRPEQCITVIIICLILFAVFAVIGSLLFNRKETFSI